MPDRPRPRRLRGLALAAAGAVVAASVAVSPAALAEEEAGASPSAGAAASAPAETEAPEGAGAAPTASETEAGSDDASETTPPVDESSAPVTPSETLPPTATMTPSGTETEPSETETSSAPDPTDSHSADPGDDTGPQVFVGDCDDPVFVLDNTTGTEDVVYFVLTFGPDDEDEYFFELEEPVAAGESVEIVWTEVTDGGEPVFVAGNIVWIDAVFEDGSGFEFEEFVVPDCDGTTGPTATGSQTLDASPTATATDGVRGGLARTGAEAGVLVAVAVLLLGGGAAAVALTIRSRRAARGGA